MSKPLLPQAFWFRLQISAPRVDHMPLAGPRGPLLDLPEACAVPEFVRLEGKEAWASVRVGWNPQGLGIAVMARGLPTFGERPEGFAEVSFWIDTRDTRTVSRATRFCHRFVTRLELASDRKSLKASCIQKPISRSVGDAPLCPEELLQARAQLARWGWTLETFLPARGLNGYDPETNRRLGFAYRVTDYEREDQYLGVGREFPLGENPSLWSTLELLP
jgi:hypothetical protein